MDGTYELLEKDDPDLFIYTRTLGSEKLLVVCSFSDQERIYPVPDEFIHGQILISNSGRTEASDPLIQPYESFVVRI